MPSPSIPRSTSQPNLSNKNPRSRHHSHHNLLVPSNRSSISAPSSFKSSWEKTARKLHISRKNNKDESSKHSDLTEESLEQHNKRQEILDQNEKTASKSSPYYKGLTDFSLVINRQKLTGGGGGGGQPSSPGKESHATSVNTSASRSSLVIRVQEWGSSCFTFKSKKNNNDNNLETPTQPDQPSKTIRASMNVIARSSLAMKEESEFLQESNMIDSTLVHDQEKSLRERGSSSESRSQSQPQSQSQSQPAESLPTKKRVVFKTENDQEMLIETEFKWADKYRPKALQDFICNRDKALLLQSMVKAGECGHFIFEGLAGVGKRTMVWAFLRETFGADKIKTWEERKQFNLKGESVGSIQVNMKKSSQHVEINLSDLKGYEKHIIVELIKERHHRESNKNVQYGVHENCKAIILHEADKLSTDALLYIKWLLERYKGYNKVFFCCSDVSKLQPIMPLCTIIQLLPPSNEEIVEVLEFIAKCEGIELPHQLAVKIAENSMHNLRQAIRSFEASWQINNTLKEDQVILTGWEDDIATVAKNIIEEQSPKQLYIIRGKLQKLIEHNVSPDFIFKTLVGELKKHSDMQFHPKIESLYDEYNSNDQSVLDSEMRYARNRNEEMSKRLNDPLNVHRFMRIEEFIAKFMSWYKFSVINTKR